MSATVTLPVAPSTSTVSTGRRIEIVSPEQQHTLIVQSGASRRCLRFNEAITGDELRAYCRDNFGWSGLDRMQMTADGHAYAPDEVGNITLQPETKQVGFDETGTKTVEFRKPAPAKG